jgi:hypothetical protein
MCPRTGLDAVEEIKVSCLFRESNPGRHALTAVPTEISNSRFVFFIMLYRQSGLFDFAYAFHLMPTELFPSDGCCAVTCLHSCYLAMVLHVAVFSVLL